MKLTLLNTSILTQYGSFKYEPIYLEEARELIKRKGFESAIGHQSTAQILSELLEVEVSVNRIQFRQKQGESAIVFKLNGRPPEGVILTKEQIEEIGYEFGILECVEVFTVQEKWFVGYSMETGAELYMIPGMGEMDAYQITERGWKFWSQK